MSLKKTLKKNQPKLSEKAGLPPGSIVYTGSPKEGKTEISLLSYNADDTFSVDSIDLKEISDKIKQENVNWINFDSLHDVEVIQEIGRRFNIHNLTLADIVHVGHQPKLEEYDEYLFLTMKMIKPADDQEIIRIEHISFVLGKNFLISFQEEKNDPFDSIRERIKSGKSKARERSSDYLLFLLIDAIIDQYLISLESLMNMTGKIEQEIMENPHEEIVSHILNQKRGVADLRKIINPLHDILRQISTDEMDFINNDYTNYYNDLYDHIKVAVDHLDNQRESLTQLMDFYMSRVSIQMNKVMQTLTIIATIFIPLTFLAGIYGMNFQFMPELSWKYGYFSLLLIMLILGVGMYIFMRRKRWF